MRGDRGGVRRGLAALRGRGSFIVWHDADAGGGSGNQRDPCALPGPPSRGEEARDGRGPPPSAAAIDGRGAPPGRVYVYNPLPNFHHTAWDGCMLL